MGNCKQSNLQLLGSEVKLGLDVHTHGACAFVENGEERLVVKQAGHRDSLFLTSR